MSTPFLAGRGRNFCRGCDNKSLFSGIDLGDLPIANELWANPDMQVNVFPLHLRICTECGLGQVEDVVTPSRLFRDYRYLSSISASFVEHARTFVNYIVAKNLIGADDWVLEIASNDGYLLRHFIEKGIRVLGIEPAENIAKLAIEKGVPSISEFFGSELAKSILTEYGYPKLIIANNVMAHVPDIKDFISGLAHLSGPETLISIENPSLMNLLREDQFDTIYHEHYSYLTAHSVNVLTGNHGLELFNVELVPTHGGSNRYWLQRNKPRTAINSRVQEFISSEIEAGLFRQDLWAAFASRIRLLLGNFHDWLKNAFEEGRIVCGYGAAAKASTLLNAARIEKVWMSQIGDSSTEKQNRYLPIHGIPIVSLPEMLAKHPTDIVIFPWNIREELSKQIKAAGGLDIHLWQAVPELSRFP